jgi:hypothetical protein
MLMRQTTEKQEPFASVLACADSRVPVEIVFDQSIGRHPPWPLSSQELAAEVRVPLGRWRWCCPLAGT